MSIPPISPSTGFPSVGGADPASTVVADMQNIKNLLAKLRDDYEHSAPIAPDITNLNNAMKQMNHDIGSLSFGQQAMVSLAIQTLQGDVSYFENPSSLTPDQFLSCYQDAIGDLDEAIGFLQP